MNKRDQVVIIYKSVRSSCETIEKVLGLEGAADHIRIGDINVRISWTPLLDLTSHSRTFVQLPCMLVYFFNSLLK